MSMKKRCLELVAIDVFCSKLEHAFKYAPYSNVLLIPVKREEVKEFRKALDEREKGIRNAI